jgi:hypothetical protein
MEIINEITMKIIKNAKNNESINSLANRIGYAYSAVYKWILRLEEYEVVKLDRIGNKNIIRINKNSIYDKFMELDNAVTIMEKNKEFFRLIKNIDLNIRFVKGSAIAMWTKGGFITGDFIDKIYFLEVANKDMDPLKNKLKNKEIAYTENNIIDKRPLVYLIPKKVFKKEIINSLPVMPLKELVDYCKRLYLDNVLEQLDLLYDLNLNKKYSEIYTNN